MKIKRQQDPLITMADFNAKLSKGREEKVVGIHGQGIRNMRGEKRVEWSSTNNHISRINRFLVNNNNKKKKGNGHGKSPGEENRNQIDNIKICKKSFRHELLSANT